MISLSYMFDTTAADVLAMQGARTSTAMVKIYRISSTKSQNLTVSYVVLQLSLPNPLKPGVKSSMKM